MSRTFDGRHSQIREDRGLVLDFINAVFPRSIREEELIGVMLTLDEPVAKEYVQRDLGYLAARGLIVSEVADHRVRRREKVRRWKLTADGVTFVERDKPWDELEC